MWPLSFILLITFITAAASQTKQGEGLNSLFVIGGNGDTIGSTEIVDLGGIGQSCAKTFTDYPFASLGAIGAFVDDIPMVCSSVGNDSRCYAYDRANDAWKTTDSMLSWRDDVATVLLSSTQWWVTGGHVASGVLETTELFTSGQGFAVGVQLPEANYFHNLVKVNETHTMLIGCFFCKTSAWLFNQVSGEWTELPEVPIDVKYGQSGLATLADGSLEVVVSGGGSTQVMIFSMDSLQWRTGLNTFPAGVLRSASSVPYGDTFLIVGGNVGAVAQKTIYVYVSADESFVALPQNLTVANGTVAAFFIPDGYLCGGGASVSPAVLLLQLCALLFLQIGGRV